MTVKAPAFPAFGSGQVVALTTTASPVTLKAKTKQVMFTNLDATNAAYVRMVGDAVAATNADAIIPAGKSVVYSKFEDTVAISIVAAAGTPSVHVMPCEGFAGH